MLTSKQRELLEFINKRVAKDGVPPSFDEMKDALNLRSKSGIHRLITALEERGFVRRLAHKARALEIVKLPDSMGHPAAVSSYTAPQSAANDGTVPMLGKIAAGRPIEAVDDGQTRIDVPGAMITSPDNHYALQVKGESMIDAGINDGDVVVIRETSFADNGDIVVAQVEGYEATLKRFRRENGMISLEAANPEVQTRVLPEGSVRIQGRLVGLIRTY